ncbi:MAG: flagellar export protein FliJ [Candidatus Lambdaproteobacteria bacterium]|nr:flagellar export protein FliJ [Candidatus Lambdaproteobacteria bacterium]
MFRFSLQTVLEVRERQEKIKYKEFSQELIRRQTLQARIEALHQDLARAGRHTDEVRRRGTSAQPLQLHEHFRNRVNAEIAVLLDQLRQQEQAVEAKRRELVKARQEHRTLEILKEKEFGRYEMELNRRERAIMDEVASNNHFNPRG